MAAAQASGLAPVPPTNARTNGTPSRECNVPTGGREVAVLPVRPASRVCRAGGRDVARARRYARSTLRRILMLNGGCGNGRCSSPEKSR